MASPILLEPVVDLKVTVPDEYTGDIMGDLSSRRGKISGMEPEEISDHCRQSSGGGDQNYSTTLRSLTQGRGFFSKSFSHYETVPAELAKKIIEASARQEQSRR